MVQKLQLLGLGRQQQAQIHAQTLLLQSSTTARRTQSLLGCHCCCWHVYLCLLPLVLCIPPTHAPFSKVKNVTSKYTTLTECSAACMLRVNCCSCAEWEDKAGAVERLLGPAFQRPHGENHQRQELRYFAWHVTASWDVQSSCRWMRP